MPTPQYVSDLYTFVSPASSPWAWGIRQYRDVIITYAQVEVIAIVPSFGIVDPLTISNVPCLSHAPLDLLSSDVFQATEAKL